MMWYSQLPTFRTLIFNNICTLMHYTALSGSGEGLSFGKHGWEGVCFWAGSSARQGRRWLEVEGGPCLWIWSCFWYRFSLPPPLFTSPASFAGREGSVKSNKLQQQMAMCLSVGAVGTGPTQLMLPV